MTSYSRLRDRTILDGDKLAVFDNKEHSYRDVLSLVQRISAYLDSIGVQEGDGVALLMSPSLTSMATIYAVSQLGAYYIPISRNSNVSRARTMIQEAKAKIAIYDGSWANRINEIGDFLAAYHLDQETVANINPRSFAVDGDVSVVLFTSGTTGVPKGVALTNKNLSYILADAKDRFAYDGRSRLIWSTNWTFDASLIELHGWAAFGAMLVIIASDPMASYTSLPQLQKRYPISHLFVSPSVLKELLRIWTPDECAMVGLNLRAFLVGGEVFSTKLAQTTRNAFATTEIFNIYGPTETTIYVTSHKFTGHEVGPALPIGKVIDGTTISLLDGEIVISGPGLANGYLNQSKIAMNPFINFKKEPAYQTGDFAFWDETSSLVFAGRKDRQVKVHGVRIEIEEVEGLIDESLKMKGVNRVIYHDGRLVCFCLPVQGCEQIKETVQKTLPVHLVPAELHLINEFPTTDSGKLDVNALARIIIENKESVQELGFTETELMIFRAFEQTPTTNSVLLNKISFDSLSFVVAINRLEGQIGRKVPDYFFSSDASVKDLARFIDGQSEQTVVNTAQMKQDDIVSMIDNLWTEWCHLRAQRCSEEFPTHPLQRTYVIDGFESSTQLIFDTSKGRSIEKLVQALIMKSDALRLNLVSSEENVVFVESISSQSLQVPVLIMPTDRDNDLVAKAAKHISPLLAKNEKDRFLHFPLVLKWANGTSTLIWTISHLISDQSNIFLLKKILADEELLSSIPSQAFSYRRFIEFILSKNDSKKLVKEPMVQSLDKIEGVLANEVVQGTDELTRLVLNVDEAQSVEQRIASVCYEASKFVANTWKKDALAFSTLANIRDFESFDATYVLGDCHSTVIGEYRCNDDFVKFSERLKETWNLYRKGLSPFLGAFLDYPKMSPEQKELERLCDTLPTLKINYLGRVNREDADELKNGLVEMMKRLSVFPGRRVFVTAFEVQVGTIEVFFLNLPKLGV
jgi:amino acid adenylation domain-containing protein